jgi:hypothetical protein
MLGVYERSEAPLVAYRLIFLQPSPSNQIEEKTRGSQTGPETGGRLVSAATSSDNDDRDTNSI